MYRVPLIVYSARMQNHPIVKEVGLEDAYQYQTYSNVQTSLDRLYCMMPNHLIV